MAMPATSGRSGIGPITWIRHNSGADVVPEFRHRSRVKVRSLRGVLRGRGEAMRKSRFTEEQITYALRRLLRSAQCLRYLNEGASDHHTYGIRIATELRCYFRVAHSEFQTHQNHVLLALWK